MLRAQTACARDIVTPKRVKRNPARTNIDKIIEMSSVTTGRKLGIAARVAGRVISQHARRSRSIAAVTRGARASASHFGRVLGQLWLEVTGFVFLALAGIGVIAFFREYARYQAGRATSSRVLLAVCFAGLFGWFGVSSFWRVRKRNQNL
jgi:uncharacterized membrane protein YbhN (UPF0104 family)